MVDGGGAEESVAVVGPTEVGGGGVLQPVDATRVEVQRCPEDMRGEWKRRGTKENIQQESMEVSI